MYLLYSDESNLEPQDSTFFIYGGIAINTEKAKDLSDDLQRIRNESGISPDFILKFKPKPNNLEHSTFNDCKKRIIQKAVERECLLFISLINHNIANTPEEARRNEINRVSFHFNSFLNRRRSSGLMLIDRFDDSQIDAQLREKFSIGLHGLPYSDPFKLDRILGYHYSAKGQSNFGSIVDIVICSFRYAINVFCKNEEPRLETASRLLRLIAPLFYKEEGESRVSEISLFFSPKIIRAPSYRQEYEKLKEFLSNNGIITAQEITDQRLY